MLCRVEALQAISPLLRYTSLLPPAPHPMAISRRCQGDRAQSLPSKSSKLTSQVRAGCRCKRDFVVIAAGEMAIEAFFRVCFEIKKLYPRL